MPDDEDPKTLSVPEAGRRYFNLSRNASYEAAARGEIPTMRFGRLLRVPVRRLERMIDGDPSAAPTGTNSVARADEAQ